MMNYKTILAPVVATVLLAVGNLTGHHFSSDFQSEVVDIGGTLIAGGVSIWGIIKNHKKEVK